MLYRLPKYNFNPPLPLKTLILAALCHPEAEYDQESHIHCTRVVENVIHKINRHKDLLLDTFGIEIKNDEICSIPRVEDCIPPYVAYLPMLILKLGTDVNFTSMQFEKRPTVVIRSIGTLLAEYYAKFIFYFKFSSED